MKVMQAWRSSKPSSTQEIPHDSKKSNHRKWWRIAGLLLCIVVIAAGIEIDHQINLPNEGQVTIGPSSTIGGYSIDLTPRNQTTALVTYQYPAGLILQKSDSSHAPIVEQFTYLGKDIETWLLGIDIATLPDGKLQNNSSYTYRLSHPEQYQLSTAQVNGQSVVISLDKNAPGFSEVAFITHESYIATISLVGDDASGSVPLQQSFNLIVHSWHWLH